VRKIYYSRYGCLSDGVKAQVVAAVGDDAAPHWVGGHNALPGLRENLFRKL